MRRSHIGELFADAGSRRGVATAAVVAKETHAQLLGHPVVA